MKTTRIIFVGGFLGAGKTSLLWEAAQHLMGKGLNVGLITNDQAPELVDTVLLSQNGLKVAEVSGSCFCCNFNGLTDAVQKVRSETSADIIIAEPVGSCTDLSATIMQPLKKLWNSELQTAPLSVLADPVRLRPILDGDTAGLHPDAAYIFRKQLEESDIILIGKSDTLTDAEMETLIERTRAEYPSSAVMPVSAVTGDGVDKWLGEVMKSSEAGMHIVAVDYDTYANGEAVLGWLNGTILLSGESIDFDDLLRNFMVNLGNRFDSAGNGVGHVKAILENGDKYIVGNITGKVDTFSLRGTAGTGCEAKLTINARVETTPEMLDEIVRDEIKKITEGCCDFKAIAWRFLQPGRPDPTYRFSEVVFN